MFVSRRGSHPGRPWHYNMKIMRPAINRCAADPAVSRSHRPIPPRLKMPLRWIPLRRPAGAGLLFCFLVGLVGLDPPYSLSPLHGCGLAAMGRPRTITWSPRRRACRSFRARQKNPHGGGIELGTDRQREVGRPAGLADLRHAHGRRRPGLRRHQRRRPAGPAVEPTRGGLVMCLDEATGKLLWQLVDPAAADCRPRPVNFDDMDLGVCSSPTVDGDRVYLVTNRCEVLCLDVHGLADGNDGPFTDEGHYMAGPGKPPVALQPDRRRHPLALRHDRAS